MAMRPAVRVYLGAAIVGLIPFSGCSLLLDFDGLTGGAPSKAPDATADGANESGKDDSEGSLDLDSGDGSADGGNESGEDDAEAGRDVDSGDGSSAPEDAGDAPEPEASTDSASSDGPVSPADADAANDGGVDFGLVALYHFDETSGTVAADSSGNGYAATMENGATFVPGIRGNAAALNVASDAASNSADQYVSLPPGIVAGLTTFSISLWFNLNVAGFGYRLFDFGTGTTTYMFATPNGYALRYDITTQGVNGEEGVDPGSFLPVSSWQHLAVTQDGTTVTLYLNGAQIAQNTAVALNPSNLGSTTQNWIGRSQYAGDSYLDGEIDEFRIYDRALRADEVLELYTQKE